MERKNVVSDEEYRIYQLLYPVISAVLDRNFISREFLQLKPANQYSSVLLQSVLICRICFRNKRKYIAVRNSALKLAALPAGFTEEQKNADGEFCRLIFDTESDAKQLEEIVSEATQLTADSIPHDFDCCSHYIECSDAKRCVHPNSGFALDCGYRKKLAHGFIFYGQNRTIPG